jgi:4-hydroxy-3-polyprenylbenzoate decarboxylase
MWRFANNFDPKRDSFISSGGIGMDGTRKTKAFDNFDRPWPNIICADEATIKSVDEKWAKFGLGKLISSPSLKYKKMLYKGGAVAEE